MYKKIFYIILSRIQFYHQVSLSKVEEIYLNQQKYFYSICTIQVGLQVYSGHGVDQSPYLAKIKSLMEAFERQCAKVCNQSYNATAAHILSSFAESSAIYEALERDAFMRFALKIIKPYENFQKGEISHLLLPTRESKVVAAITYKIKNECITFGMGAAKKVQDAIAKANCEFLLSEARHREFGCKHNNKVYEELHKATGRAQIRYLFSNIGCKEKECFEPKFEKVNLVDSKYWPIKAVAVIHPELFVLDLDWMLSPRKNLNHTNNKLIKKLNINLDDVIFFTG